METIQIIMLSILVLVYLFTHNILSKGKENDFSIILNFLSVALLVTLVIELTISHNKELNKTSKCPEYERIDNVYKLKQ